MKKFLFAFLVTTGLIFSTAICSIAMAADFPTGTFECKFADSYASAHYYGGKPISLHVAEIKIGDTSLPYVDAPTPDVTANIDQKARIKGIATFETQVDGSVAMKLPYDQFPVIIVFSNGRLTNFTYDCE
jgi:hypothetical protein